MKSIVKTMLCLAVIALAACAKEKPRDFFAKGGITIGDPAALGSGTYRIPLAFETAIVHSGQWIDIVDADVVGTDILLTTSFTPATRKSRYPGYVEVNGVSPGTYTLKYRDPDGTVHVIDTVILS